jgi:acetyltransferase-like isoleucine patch superfamily enzyme
MRRIARRSHSAVRLHQARRRVDVTAAVTASIGKVRLTSRGKRGSILLGERSRIDDGVILAIAGGGRIILGPDVHIRSGAVLNVSGLLELRGKNIISWYATVHCEEHVVLEDMVCAAEGVTITDSDHFHGKSGTDNEHFHANTVSSPVFVGKNTWLGAKSTVTRGVTLGERVTVAAHSIVRTDFGNDQILAGIPARAVRRSGSR